MSEADLRNAIRGALAKFNAAVEAAIRRELAEPFDLGHSDRLQFEVDGFGGSTHLVQTENVIFEGAPIFVAVSPLFEALDEETFDFLGLVYGELFPWFAERWAAVDGPRFYSPAYMYYHGTADEPRYDLEQRRWFEVGEVWPD